MKALGSGRGGLVLNTFLGKLTLGLQYSNQSIFKQAAVSEGDGPVIFITAWITVGNNFLTSSLAALDKDIGEVKKISSSRLRSMR